MIWGAVVSGAVVSGAVVSGADVSGAAAEPQATANSRASITSTNGVRVITLDFLSHRYTMIEPPDAFRFRLDSLCQCAVLSAASAAIAGLPLKVKELGG